MKRSGLTLKGLTLCALLSTIPNASFRTDYPNEIKNNGINIVEKQILQTIPEYDPFEKIKINSITQLSANRYGDKDTWDGIENMLNNKVDYKNIMDDLISEYENSNSEIIIISGHHFTGHTYFFDSKRKEFLFLNKMKRNDNTKILLIRACHSVMNPEFLKEKSEEHKYLCNTAEDFIKAVENFAPNIRLIIGYETRAPLIKDNPIIAMARDYWLVEKKGYKAYGNHALDLSKKMFEFKGKEKNRDGEWNYLYHFGTNISESRNERKFKANREGTRLAYYLKEKTVWNYYSLDHPNGIKVTDLDMTKK